MSHRICLWLYQPCISAHHATHIFDVRVFLPLRPFMRTPPASSHPHMHRPPPTHVPSSPSYPYLLPPFLRNPSWTPSSSSSRSRPPRPPRLPRQHKARPPPSKLNSRALPPSKPSRRPPKQPRQPRGSSRSRRKMRRRTRRRERRRAVRIWRWGG